MVGDGGCDGWGVLAPVDAKLVALSTGLYSLISRHFSQKPTNNTDLV
jgi:hypothetical protein